MAQQGQQVVPGVCAKRLGSPLHLPGPGIAEPAQDCLWRGEGLSGSAPTHGTDRHQTGSTLAWGWSCWCPNGGLSLSPGPRFETPGEAMGVRSCTLPSTLGLCHTAVHHPLASPQGFCLPRNQQPMGLLGGRGPPPARAAPSGNLDPEGSELLCVSPFLPPFPPRTAVGTVFWTVGRGQVLALPSLKAVGRTQRVLGPGGPASTAPGGGSGPAGRRLPALLGQRMQKAGVCCRHRFPFMALLLPSLELGDG